MPTKIKYDETLADIVYCKSADIEIVDRTNSIQGEVDTLISQVTAIQCQVDELSILLRSAMDAKTDRSKQKWLWEIFEPNDINIDFPYNL